MNNLPAEKFNDVLLITFADLLSIVRKNKTIIRLSASIFALLAFFYGLTKPVEYEAEATFKEKGKSQSGLGSSLNAAFFLMSDSVDSNALTIMRSRVLIEDLIKDQSLQGVVSKKKSRFPFISFETIKNNLLIEYALFKKLPNPVLRDPEKDFRIGEIAYNSEVPKNFRMKVLSKEQFNLYDESKGESITGFFSQPVIKEDYSFTISQANRLPVAEGEYIIALLPLGHTAKSLSKQFIIESDRYDKNLLKITYKNADRQLAKDNVNALMAIYQRYIEQEHKQICEKQVGYLIQRQKEMGKVLEIMMQSHAHELSSDLSSTGFATSKIAMDFLANAQHRLKEKLLSVSLDIQRLQRARNDGPTNSDIFSSSSYHDIINKIATEKRLLKQQADSLSLVLRNLPSQSQEFKQSFSSQLQDLEEIKQSLKETALALGSLEKNEVPARHPKLINDSKYTYNAWRERLIKLGQNLNAHPSKKECLTDWEQCRAGFTSYLSHLNYFLNVYQRSVEERLAHQQAPLKEFQGINLNIAQELYITYNRDLSHVESQSTQHEFILSQLNEPNFEYSSLSTILVDPLSLEAISRTSNLILALKDQDNRSAKEQERLNADLQIQKSFLKTHIQQSLSLLSLRESFLKEKIQRLQSVNLSLIQQQISILENQIKEYITGTLENLNQEKQLIEKNLAELRIEMSSFPQKWAAEQLIDQQMEINKSLVEEISKLVESKNISNNLEKLQSSPVDRAIAPIHPKSPRLLLLTLMGATLGAFLSFFWILGKSVAQGVQASGDNLQAAGLNVCGFISRNYQEPIEKDPPLDSDLATLRRLMTFISTQNNSKELKNTLLLLEGKGPRYAAPLAELLALKGLKVLILELHFDEVQNVNNLGVLQYLEGKLEEPTILHFSSYDKIMAGGVCRYANELISSQRFKELLAFLTKQYDWVIVSSSANAKSAGAENLATFFPYTAISISDESVHDLKSWIRYANEQKNKIVFIMTAR